MIVSFRHRGLERFFVTGTGRVYDPNMPADCGWYWVDSSAAESPKDMDLPGLRLHPLKGKLKGRWSVIISGNWRVTFTFDGKDAVLVDYEDYH